MRTTANVTRRLMLVLFPAAVIVTVLFGPLLVSRADVYAVCSKCRKWFVLGKGIGFARNFKGSCGKCKAREKHCKELRKSLEDKLKRLRNTLNNWMDTKSKLDKAEIDFAKTPRFHTISPGVKKRNDRYTKLQREIRRLKAKDRSEFNRFWELFDEIVRLKQQLKKKGC